MDIRLVRWSAESYRSWPSFSVEPPPSGVVLIKGRSLDAPTTSGVGKSSLVAAIASALGVGPPSTKSTTWGAKRQSVSAEFAVGDQPLTVSRHDRLRVVLGDTRVEGDLAEERLSTIFGSGKIVGPLTWRRQRKRGHFFAKTASERAAFLAEVLDLGRFERAGRSARLAADKIQAEMSLAEGRLAAEEATAALPRIPVPSAPALTSFESLEAEVATMEAQQRAAMQAYREEAAGQQQLQAEIARVRSDLGKLAAMRSKLAVGIAVSSGRCPTCGSVTVLADSSEAQKQLAVVDGLAAELTASEREIGSKMIALAPPSIPHLSGKLAELRQAREERDRQASYLARCEAESRARDREIAQAALSCQEIGRRLGDLRQAHTVESDLFSWERAWRMSFAAELLEDLTAETNSVLACIPNVSSVSVRFFPRETSSGGHEVADAVMVDGADREDGLSEGQQSSVELACDLALRSVVGARCNNRPRWFVLDEPFEGMGLKDRESFMEWMREQGDLYLVIDTHSREFSEIFAESGIGVEMSGGRSRMVSAEERASW